MKSGKVERKHKKKIDYSKLPLLTFRYVSSVECGYHDYPSLPNNPDEEGKERKGDDSKKETREETQNSQFMMESKSITHLVSFAFSAFIGSCCLDEGTLTPSGYSSACKIFMTMAGCDMDLPSPDHS